MNVYTNNFILMPVNHKFLYYAEIISKIIQENVSDPKIAYDCNYEQKLRDRINHIIEHKNGEYNIIIVGYQETITHNLSIRFKDNISSPVFMSMLEFIELLEIIT